MLKALFGVVASALFILNGAFAALVLPKESPSPDVLSTWELPRLWKVPDLNPHFSGRQELLCALHKKMEHEPLVLITGNIGVGKTQFAKGYVYQFLPYYDIIGWFNVDETLSVQLQKFIKALNGHTKETDQIPTHLSFESLLDAFASFLRKHGVKCLLIFDNADEVEKLTPYLSLTQGTKGRILVTTRIPTTFYTTLSVGSFSRQDSLDFLHKILPQIPPLEHEQLAQALADHPLALSLAAGFLHFTPSANVQNYLTLKERSLAIHPRVFTDQYVQDLSTTVRLTLRTLKEKSPQALEFVQFLAHIHPSQIPLSLAEEWLKAKPKEAQRVLRVLFESSLVEIQNAQKPYNQNKPLMLSIHPLVHQIIGEQSSLQERQRLLEKALPLIAMNFAGKSEGISTRILRHPEFFLHAKKLSALAEELSYHSLPLLSLRIRMLNYLHTGLRDFEQASKLVALIEANQEALKSQDFINKGLFSGFETFQLSLEDRVIYETERGFLAAALEMDWKSSVSHGMRALELLKHSPEEHAERLRVTSNILQAYTFTGNLQQANLFLNEAMPTFKACTNPLRRMAFVLSWAGLLTAEGKFKESLALLEQYEPLLQCLRDHPPTGTTFLRARAENLVRLRRREECSKILEQLQQVIQSFYGEREPPILATLFVLKTYNHLNQQKKASLAEIVFLKKALAIYEKAWKGDSKNPYQGFAQYVLGRAYESQGNNIAAIKAYQDAEKIYDAVLQNKATYDMSILYGVAGRLAHHLKYERLARSYLKKQSKTFGLEHPRTEELMRVLEDDSGSS